jgi:hypothetical protein
MVSNISSIIPSTNKHHAPMNEILPNQSRKSFRSNHYPPIQIPAAAEISNIVKRERRISIVLISAIAITLERKQMRGESESILNTIMKCTQLPITGR